MINYYYGLLFIYVLLFMLMCIMSIIINILFYCIIIDVGICYYDLLVSLLLL